MEFMKFKRTCNMFVHEGDLTVNNKSFRKLLAVQRGHTRQHPMGRDVADSDQTIVPHCLMGYGELYRT